MIAAILAGGEGKRLRPYSFIFPKPLLPLGEKPILEILLEKLKTQGIKDVYLAVNYKAWLFEKLFGDGEEKGVQITYLREEKPLGTAGPLKNLQGVIEESLFVINGDIIADIDLSELQKSHQESKSDITVVTRKITNSIGFGVIQSEDEKIVDWKEKPEMEIEISAGMYLLEPSVLEVIPVNEFYDMPSLVKEVIKQGKKVSKFLYTWNIIDISTIDDSHQFSCEENQNNIS